MADSNAKKWIDLGIWGKGMDGFKLPPSVGLAGKELTLSFIRDKQIISCFFNGPKSLTWRVLKGAGSGVSESVTYDSICVEPDIYFVDFVKTDKPGESVSLALDLRTAQATVVTATLPDIKTAEKSFLKRLEQGVDLSLIKVKFQHASINVLSKTSVIYHQRTTDLVGKRIKYTYSDQHVYEHIYLNDRMYTWHCLVGLEKGLADTEVCDYFKIAPEIYLFVWREKILPTFGAVIIDLKEMRSNGKTFGLDVSTGKYINFAMGARAELLNVTHYS
jgi:hypothetical protein